MGKEEKVFYMPVRARSTYQLRVGDAWRQPGHEVSILFDDRRVIARPQGTCLEKFVDRGLQHHGRQSDVVDGPLVHLCQRAFMELPMPEQSNGHTVRK